jgi:hypothetical protein
VHRKVQRENELVQALKTVPCAARSSQHAASFFQMEAQLVGVLRVVLAHRQVVPEAQLGQKLGAHIQYCAFMWRWPAQGPSVCGSLHASTRLQTL